MANQSLAVHSILCGTVDSMGRPRRITDPWVDLFRDSRVGVPERPKDWRKGDPIPDDLRAEFL